MFNGDKKEEEKKVEEKKPEKKPVKPSSGKKIRIDEFMPNIVLQAFARNVVKEHLKKALGGKATQSEYQAEFDKFMNREIK